MIKFKTTKDIKIDKSLINQVIGQDAAVEIIKKAAKQRRHVLLIGDPGTGKSMLGMALAELLPKEKLVDILTYPNFNDESQPLIRVVPKGLGRLIVNKANADLKTSTKVYNIVLLIVVLFASFFPYYLWKTKQISDIIYAASMVTSMIFILGFMLFMNMSKNMNKGNKAVVPKLIADNSDKKTAPFIDATGAHAGALLGDVLHDPFQSGGLGTPAHERVVAGMIHKTNMGVLFIDEISTMTITTQQELLTAIQEKKYPITGQSERSAGAMVRTEPVPCDFILVAAGNFETIKNMHPALRSRIRGYGYEVYMNETMKDTPKNRDKLISFVAQEVNKDKKIPHFNKDAVLEIIEEARRRANRKGHLTLRLRELGGLIRAAGDLAKEENSELVNKDHVIRAKKLARTLEKQIADKIIENKKDYNVIMIKGTKIGRINGLAVIGSGSAFSGIVQPIEAETTTPGKNKQILATGNLGKIAKESIINVSAIVKKLFGNNLDKYDIYVQFLQTYEGIEGDSASIATAIAIISSLKNIPVKQDVAITGSLSVRGEVLPVGGVSSKVEAAIEAGIKKVIVPKSNLDDIVIDKSKLKKIKIIPVESIYDVFPIIFDIKNKSAKELINKIKKEKEI